MLTIKILGVFHMKTRLLVNVAPLFESLSSGSSLGYSLTSRQVNETHLAHFLPRILFIITSRTVNKKNTFMG